MKFEQLQNNGIKKWRDFEEFASSMVSDAEMEFTGEDKTVVVRHLAQDMALGAAFKRNEHIITGVVIGSVGILAAWGISNIIKRRNTTKG